MRQTFIKRKYVFFCVWGIILFFSHWSFSQSKSYEDRLSQIATKETNRNLGTLSGRNKDEMRQKDLFNAYAYVPSQKETNAPKRETFENAYVEFRNQHEIPNYIGDAAVKQALKKSKDNKIKVELVKIVEAEKILHDTFKAFHEEKAKAAIESTILTAIGNKKDLGVASYQKEMNDRIDLVGEKTASILNTSIQTLSASKLIDELQPKGEVYMTSGGRVFPKLEIEEDKDFLNLRGYVMERVQKELMASMTQSINNFYHNEQKETAKATVEKKEQLLAFVKVEDKGSRHQEMKQERIEAIKGWLETARTTPENMAAERMSLNAKMIDEIQGQMNILRNPNASSNELDKLYRTLEKFGIINPQSEALFRKSDFEAALRKDYGENSKQKDEQIKPAVGFNPYLVNHYIGADTSTNQSGNANHSLGVDTSTHDNGAANHSIGVDTSTTTPANPGY